MSDEDYRRGYKQAVKDALEICKEQRTYVHSHYNGAKARRAIGWVMERLQKLKPGMREST
ncbi:MAG: hypothetical protein AAF478_03620 [Pseudomonadota bacterium]